MGLEGRSCVAAGRATKFEYDTKHRVTKITYPDNSYERRIYDMADQLTQTIDARGNATTYQYDGYGRLWKVTDALSHVTATYGYDAMSRV